MKLILPLVFFYVLLIPMDGWAQGCPVGQYQIGGQGAVACAPIPQGNSIQQETRPSGKWIKTWGAIARDDDGGNLGVSTGALEKKKAGHDALEQCEKESKKKCKVVMSYENQCVAVARPNAIGTMTFNRGPSAEDTKNNAISDCQKENNGTACSIIYNDCTQQIFRSF
ncbi:DUF4189 domain-containing protein [Xanthomonas campestris]|uniref:DUF4189 domain-containing protein n=1 Tax=Xanthomonas campestris TaxID=339 RepID=UPI002429ACAD|nr:DUF4189 domain-containing protein [Xanthomonas campestris]MBV6815137.1 DUF4189 domain-containing protein [Xanthomonas campestris pv. passiflorae]